MASKKDNVDLICSIGELAGMFERSSSITDFLGSVVSVVAYHMNAAVCSIYLWSEETQELVLRANQGLNPDLINKLTLTSGKGLVGLALKELRPINAGRAFDNPNFAYIPGLNEERYQSLLAVPMLRGLQRVGVLVVQDPQRDYFDENDVKALQAIAAQLTTTIENAKLIMSLYGEEAAGTAKESGAPLPGFFKGVGISRGHVLGRANVLGSTHAYIRLMEKLGSRPNRLTGADFRRALARSEAQLEGLQNDFEKHHGDVASLIFSAQLLMLKDSQFSGSMISAIEDGARPDDAVVNVVNEYVALFMRSKHALLREKAQDVKDLGHRILLNMSPQAADEASYHDEILISGELLPSDIVKFSAQQAAGVILVGGGSSSHITILARSMDLPMVVLNDERALTIESGTILLMDAEHGTVIVKPDADVISKHRELVETEKSAERLAAGMHEGTRTRCGTSVELLANINLLSELRVAVRLKADGVGLYRSEFPFIVRSEFPSEEEQYRIYRTIVDRMPGKPVTLRTLDVGGDKVLPYFPMANKANPVLGMRAIRFTLRHRDIFENQLCAMLRAAQGADCRILFPMVSSMDEFVLASQIVGECAARLAEHDIPHLAKPLLGAMVELPSAVEIADELAEAADFLCIGSNDLVQYILAVDRTNEAVADLYLPQHPSVLRALKRVVAAAGRHGTPISICGEIAANEKLLPFLLGIGLRKFSVDARMLPHTQSVIQSIDLAAAGRTAAAMLASSRISEIESLLQHTDRSGALTGNAG